MKCTECGREFPPDHAEEEICPECQVADLPEAQSEGGYFDENDWRYDEPEDDEDEEVHGSCERCGSDLEVGDDLENELCDQCSWWAQA